MTEKKTVSPKMAAILKKIEALEKRMEKFQKEFCKSKVKAG
jgi:hypothetical protein